MRLIPLFFGLIFLFSSLTAWGDPPLDAYNIGVQLYQQEQYNQAIASLKEAVRLDPQSWQAYQILAFSYNQVGDQAEAIAAVQSSLTLHPDNPDLRKWAAQLGYQTHTAYLSGITPPPIRDITFFKMFDIRITFEESWINLADFQNNKVEFQNLSQYLNSSGDNARFYIGNIPEFILPQVDLEASIRLTPELEGGLFFSYLPVGTVTNNLQPITAYYGPNGAIPVTLRLQDAYSISAIEVGVQGRYTFAHGNFRPFVSGGVVAVPMQIIYGINDIYINVNSNELVNEKLNETFGALGFGGQVQVGLDWDLGQCFAVSPSVGYQILTATNFQTLPGSGGERMALDVVQTDFGAALEPIQNGNLERIVYRGAEFSPYYPGTPAPNSSAWTLALSGFKGGLQISYSF